MGRPLSTPKPGIKYPNRLRELRSLRGLSQEELAAQVGISQTEVGKLETGKHQLKVEQLKRFAGALEVPTGAILGEQDMPIPIRYRIAAFGGPVDSDELEPRKPLGYMRPARPVAEPEQCFGALVADDSADLIYPPGTVLMARRTEHLGGELPVDGRTKFIVKIFSTNLAAGDLQEILVGLLDQAVDGSLTLVTRTRNRHIRHGVALRRPMVSADFHEIQQDLAPRDRPVQYRSDAADLGLILGRVERAERPE